MARIMGIDYGTKRTGIAVTDSLQIIASALETVPTALIFDFLKKYLHEENVSHIVVGEPKHMDGNPSQIADIINNFVRQIAHLYPHIVVVRQDERLTSSQAQKFILQSGIGREKRKDKSLLDKISAAIILESYMKAHVWTS